MQTESKEKSVYNPICPVKAQSKWNENQKEKNQKANPCKDSVKNLWYSVSVFWFKLCSRRLTERKAAILSVYNIYIIGIWIYISLAIIRSVSLRLQNEGQKKLTDRTDARGVFDTDFFDLYFFRCIGILNGFASVTACGCWENEETTFGGRKESQLYNLEFIVLRKASAHALAKSV